MNPFVHSDIAGTFRDYQKALCVVLSSSGRSFCSAAVTPAMVMLALGFDSCSAVTALFWGTKDAQEADLSAVL